MISESSCGHTLNADLSLSKLDRLRWLYLNWRNNVQPEVDVDPALERSRFHVAEWMTQWSRIDRQASPARRLCDLFWMSLPWERITAALGGKIRMLEIGCGTGRYGLLLRSCAGEGFGGYRGLDVVADEQWQELERDPQFAFACASSDQVAQFIGDANLIFTQSALEHFEGDMAFFRQLAQHVSAADRPILQVHLIPSAGCLRTFLWHGVRQYTPRTVSRITRLFGHDYRKRLYALGSARSNQVHRRYITYPWFAGITDRRQRLVDDYDRDLREALRLDDAAPKHGEACFYALILQNGVAADVLPLQG